MLEFLTLSAQERRVYTLQPLPFSCSLATSRSLDLSTSRSCQALISYLAYAVVTPLAKHVRDCDSEGLRGHACEYATMPIAKMPCSDGDGFCLVASLAVALVTLCLSVRLLDETSCASTVWYYRPRVSMEAEEQQSRFLSPFEIKFPYIITYTSSA